MEFLLTQTFYQGNSISALYKSTPVPRYFKIHTPPEVVDSQPDVVSPSQLSTALASIHSVERARMFLHGMLDELAKSLNRIDARHVPTKTLRLYSVHAKRLIHRLLVLCRFGFINSGSLVSRQQDTGVEDREPGML